jgi:type I restriction enzyme M protein
MATNGHADFIWSIAKRLRGAFKQHEYGSIILPLTLLRRLDQVLAPTRAKVLEEAAKHEGSGLDPDRFLKKASGQLFYNASKLTLDKVLADPDHVATNLRTYVAGFDPVVRDIFEAFKFDTTITELENVDRLYSLLGRFLDPGLDLHPDTVPNEVMGDIFEELIRRFSEISNETAGEHFTPREVVRLCAELALAGDEDLLSTPGAIRKVYDPACGTGGMLSVMEELVRVRNPKARLVLYGQELNPESWAVCRAEMLVKGQDPSRISPGSTLAEDGAEAEQFDLMLANPPFGVDWADDYDAVVKEHERLGDEGRFGAGLPRKNDGALLFLQNMLAKRKPEIEGGSRIAIVFNGSALVTGGAGTGESEIRRWIIENDWLEAVVALPGQLFYNTPLGTYIWVLSDRKEEKRRRRVQLIDARDLWEPMPRSLGDKRRRLSPEHIAEIVAAWREYELESERSKVRENDFFAFTRVVVERPLRLRYRAGESAIEALRLQGPFAKLTVPKKGSKTASEDRAAGEATQQRIVDFIRSLNGFETTNRDKVDEALAPLWREVEVTPSVKKAVVDALSVRDPDAPAVAGRDGRPEPDPQLRTQEQVPVDETIDEYMSREVLPYAAEAWPDLSKNKLGYDIPIVRLFFKPTLSRPLDEVEADVDTAAAELAAALARASG